METKILKNYNLCEFQEMELKGTEKEIEESIKIKKLIAAQIKNFNFYGLNSDSELIMKQFPEKIDLNYETDTPKKETNHPTYEAIVRELLGDIYYLMDSRFTQLLVNRLVCLVCETKITAKDFKKFYETTYQIIREILLNREYDYQPTGFKLIQQNLCTIEAHGDQMPDFWENYSILTRIQALKEEYTEEYKGILESKLWKYLIDSRTKTPEDIFKDIVSGEIFLKKLKEETVRPENFNGCEIKVQYDIYHEEIRLEGEKHRDFIDIAKANKFYWSYPIWWRDFFTDYTGTMEDRTAGVISDLLEAGFEITCNDSEIVKKALKKDFVKETPYWVYYTNGEFRVTIGNNYNNLKRLKYLQYRGMSEFEVVSPKKIPEFLDEYDYYKITELAQKELSKIK